ncbi:MAG: hypothetical protein LIR50_19185 [Bacillota bacterium]|nr:hypothetical protein [Bacillota bacterium]
MKVNELRVGDIVVVNNSYMGRPTCHYIVIEVNGEKYLSSFYGDVNCGPYACGWYEYNDNELPFGTILVARPKFQYGVFSRQYDNKEWFEILYKNEEEI